MLVRTKQYLKNNHYQYKKAYIRPLMAPDNVYIFRFGKNNLNNRLIIRYGHKWTGRQKINEIDLRLHKQKHPRIFKTESDLLDYLKHHLHEHELKLKAIKDMQKQTNK